MSWLHLFIISTYSRIDKEHFVFLYSCRTIDLTLLMAHRLNNRQKKRSLDARCLPLGKVLTQPLQAFKPLYLSSGVEGSLVPGYELLV